MHGGRRCARRASSAGELKGRSREVAPGELGRREAARAVGWLVRRIVQHPRAAPVALGDLGRRGAARAAAAAAAAAACAVAAAEAAEDLVTVWGGR